MGPACWLCMRCNAWVWHLCGARRSCRHGGYRSGASWSCGRQRAAAGRQQKGCSAVLPCTPPCAPHHPLPPARFCLDVFFHADCGMDWKYRQVESGEWDVLEKMVRRSCALPLSCAIPLGVWTGLGSKAKEDGEVARGSRSCPAAISSNLHLAYSMLYCTHSWLLDSARHCCHRCHASCRAMGATAARAAAARGASTAASWRVSRGGHMALATGGCSLAGCHVQAAIQITLCPPPVEWPASPLYQRSAGRHPTCLQTTAWMRRCRGTTSTPASPSGGSKPTCRWAAGGCCPAGEGLLNLCRLGYNHSQHWDAVGLAKWVWWMGRDCDRAGALHTAAGYRHGCKLGCGSTHASCNFSFPPSAARTGGGHGP